MRPFPLLAILLQLACLPALPDAGGPWTPPDGVTPDPGPVPAGSVAPGGGAVERLWFAVTGDTRPGACDDLQGYPRAAISRLARSMRALRVQFALDLGDHLFVCAGGDAMARDQMQAYLDGIAQGPATWFMTMGNHECGSGACSVDGPHDANFSAWMAALGRAKPWYSFDVRTGPGLARFVVVADDAWGEEQADWLTRTLDAADTEARLTILARHHPVSAGHPGNPAIVQALQGHRLALVLTGHEHLYAHDRSAWGGRTVILGLGGAPSSEAPGFGTVIEDGDGSLTFVRRDALGQPLGAPWSVTPP